VTTEPDAPANTRMMNIVHEALRRDLGRAHDVLTRDPRPPVEQQRAIAEHLVWMLQFLRAHHRSEDEGLFPLLRRRDAGARDVLDAMHDDHEAAVPRIANLEAAAGAVVGGTGHVDVLAAAVAGLSEVLLPHLQREEDDLLPLVSAAITNAEWRALEDQYNLDPKSFGELGREGHWLIDDASPEDRQTVLSLVPAIPRFILLHGFARSYRRRSAACWVGPSRAGRRVQKQGRCEVRVDADADAVWEIVRDVTRVGEWSHECVGATWLDGATAAAPGVRFRGRNHNGIFRWGRVCEILAAEPYELVWRTVPTLLYPDSTQWTIRLHRDGRGTRIEQSFSVIRAPKALDIVYATALPAHRDRSEALTADLRRLGAVAGVEQQHVRAS
jgi:hypothetical protein